MCTGMPLMCSYLVFIGVAISALASLNVNRTFKKYNKLLNDRCFLAQDIAALIMRGAGINDVRIERIKGTLTNHYSPQERVLRLSDSVYGSMSVAALGVAAHECGHAIQHKVGYYPLKLRALSVPVANFGSKLSWPIIMVGLILGKLNIARIGVLLFAFVVLFQLITLPVEFNTSKRALRILEEQELLAGAEMDATSKVLKAAALTYVAALFSAILQLLRLVILTRNSGQKQNYR